MFLEHISDLPRPHDRDRAARGRDDLLHYISELCRSDAETATRLRALVVNETASEFLAGLFGNSPYLGRGILREPEFLLNLLEEDPEVVLAEQLELLPAAAKNAAMTLEGFMALLRQVKRRIALLVAACDIAGIWRDGEVTARLSDFADLAVAATLDRLLRASAAKGDILLEDLAKPGQASGLVLLALGKHGGRELNYSSDIDFVAFYDETRVRYQGRKTAQDCFIRMLQSLVKIMQESTADGYVLRTDLRLRPDPGVTPIVISMTAAENYYESMGQNWERAAWIKARPIAGDFGAGEAFLARLQPFIWRRNLDFAAIEDVHSIKRQIHSYRGFSTVAVAGHNVKVGRGGIRDIEFFVQTQQLIAGGRDLSLRQRGTIAAMEALQARGWIKPAVAAAMIEAYHFHRRVEHRLQMINDEQTHTIGEQAGQVEHLAAFLGYPTRAAFEAAILARLHTVEKHYSALFEREASLSSGGNLVFTGTDNDPATLTSLAEMGFRDPVHVSELVRGWHHGRYQALRAARSREILTKIMPRLLVALARTSEPDRAITRFDKFLHGLPGGVQLFSMLAANPDLMDLLADLMGDAPRLEEYLSRNPSVLDAVIGGDFLAPQPPLAELKLSLEAGIKLARDLQEALDVVRRFTKERRFQLGVQSLKALYEADELGRGYADLAEAAITGLYPRVADDFARREGRGFIPGAELVILAMGKFGSREMTGTSDLDLVFIYDFDASIEASDGERPLPPTLYFARLCQRLLNAITAPTAEGTLYEVDMRLRPSGNKGPVATQLRGFIDYHQGEAWTWEHMALTRGRVIFGGDGLRCKVEKVIKQVLCQPREAAAIAADAVKIRSRIFKENATDNPWDLKHVRGGLVDLEFICQYQQLIHGHAHPEILSAHNRTAFRQLKDQGLMAVEIADPLIAASLLFSNLSALVRVAVSDIFDPQKATPGLAKAMALAGDTADIESLQAKLLSSQQMVRQYFDRTLSDPKAA